MTSAGGGGGPPPPPTGADAAPSPAQLAGLMMKLNSAESSDELAAVLQDLDALAARRVGVLDKFVVSGGDVGGRSLGVDSFTPMLRWSGGYAHRMKLADESMVKLAVRRCRMLALYKYPITCDAVPCYATSCDM